MCTGRCWSMSQCEAIRRGENPWAEVDRWKTEMAQFIFRAPYDAEGEPLPRKVENEADREALIRTMANEGTILPGGGMADREGTH